MPFFAGFAHMLRGSSSGGGSGQGDGVKEGGEGVLSGRAELLAWQGAWLLLCVAGHDPARCHSCNDAKPNILR